MSADKVKLTPELCRKLREERMLTQKDLGDMAGVSKQTIMAFENGKSGLTAKNMRAIAYQLGLMGPELSAPLLAPRPPSAEESLAKIAAIMEEWWESQQNAKKTRR